MVSEQLDYLQSWRRREGAQPTLTMRMTAAEMKVSTLDIDIKEILVWIKGVDARLKDADEWRSTVDTNLTKLRHTVENLGKRVTNLESAPPPPSRPETPRPSGHRVEDNHQGELRGTLTVPGQTLVKGDSPCQHTPVVFYLGASSSKGVLASQHNGYHPREFRMPKAEFPKFSGEHPRVF